MNKQLTKRDLMIKELFWPIFESPRLQKYAARKGNSEAMDMALEDTCGIVDEMLILLKEKDR